MSGTIESRILERSIIRHVPAVFAGTGIGDDYMVIYGPQEERWSTSDSKAVSDMQGNDIYSGGACNNQMVLISGKGYNDIEPIGEKALVRAINNLATAGVFPESITIDIQASEELSEDVLRREMNSLTELCRKRKIRIAGGNTVRNSYMKEGCSFLITAFGYMSCDAYKVLSDRKGAKPGDKVIIVGDTGAYGAACIIKENMERLAERFAPSYLRSAVGSDNPGDYEITVPANAMLEGGAVYIHDISFGGIYRTLYEVSERCGLGIKVIHEHIPIKQSTIEICEYYNLNPYQLLGTGGVVGVCPAERLDLMKDTLRKAGVDYSVAGELTEAREKVIVSYRNDMKRFLVPYK